MKILLCLYLATVCAAATAPRPVDTPSPVYPTELSESGMRGSAVIDARVKPDGTVADLLVRRADHPAFGAAACAAFQGWRFAPPGDAGAPVEARVSVPFEFIPPFERQFNALCKRRVYQPLSETPLSTQDFGREPKARKKIKPVYPQALLSTRLLGEVRIDFIVGPDGKTLNPKVRGRPWEGFILPALSAVAAATYVPPVKNGKGVYVAMTARVRLEPPPIIIQRYHSFRSFGSAPAAGTCGTGCGR